MPTRTLKLVRSIDSGDIAGDSIEELAELAKLNKVLLGFLRRVGYQGPLRIMEESLYRRYMAEVARVSEALRGLDYAFYKFRKPVEHVSVDIDVLVRYEHLLKAVTALAGMGFRVEVLEPYTVTMIRSGTIVDLYTHPSFAWIMYLDGERLLEETETIKIDSTGVEAKALTKEAETIATAAHAIYKEHIYLLTDYYTVKYWLNNKALSLARELRAKEAVKTALRLNEQIEAGQVEAPVKLKPIQVMEILTRKFVEDSDFRTTTINVLKLIARKRAMQQLIQRIKRKTY
ncbi:MAG: hypothetical protein QXO20_07585 [Candidatus Bathyarchaeia archaeon]